MLKDKYIKQIQDLRPIDDILMRCMFKNNLPLSEYILRIFTNIPDLKVTSVSTQKDTKYITGARSIIMGVAFPYIAL